MDGLAVWRPIAGEENPTSIRSPGRMHVEAALGPAIGEASETVTVDVEDVQRPASRNDNLGAVRRPGDLRSIEVAAGWPPWLPAPRDPSLPPAVCVDHVQGQVRACRNTAHASSNKRHTPAIGRPRERPDDAVPVGALGQLLAIRAV